jgi:hypothetical protein
VEEFKSKVTLRNFSIRDLAINGFATFPIEKLCLPDYDDFISERAVYLITK